MGGKIQGGLLDVVGFVGAGPWSEGLRVTSTLLLILFETLYKVSPLRFMWTPRLKSPEVILY